MNTQLQNQTKASAKLTPVPSSLLQRKCACGNHTMSGSECAECSKNKQTLQRASLFPRGREMEGEGEVPTIVHEVLRSPGQPLDTATRAFMEPRFGHDFSQVRVHTDAKAAESARAVNSLAYTVGQDIVFVTGQYAPSRKDGQSLLAHELAHVIQQNRPASFSAMTADFTAPDHTSEQEARKVGHQIANGLTISAPKVSMQVGISREVGPSKSPEMTWGQKVRHAQTLTGVERDKYYIELVKEALGNDVKKVHLGTNRERTALEAAKAGKYVEYGRTSSLNINFDYNIDKKADSEGDYGATPHLGQGKEIKIFIVLGPLSVNEVSPEYTRMALDHEKTHVGQLLAQSNTGKPVKMGHAQELEAYTSGFVRFFLNLWTIKNTPPCEANIAEDFTPMLSHFSSAGKRAQDQAFLKIKTFYEDQIKSSPCNKMKFCVWLQGVMNQQPLGDVLVSRINGLPELNLKRGDDSGKCMKCPTQCP